MPFPHTSSIPVQEVMTKQMETHHDGAEELAVRLVKGVVVGCLQGHPQYSYVSVRSPSLMFPFSDLQCQVSKGTHVIFCRVGVYPTVKVVLLSRPWHCYQPTVL